MRFSTYALLVALIPAAGCDYSGDWLFAQPTEVPGVIDLGPITPSDVASVADLPGAIHYGEVGATGSAERGGVTFNFLGNGQSMCLWVDPELVFWNQSVSKLKPTVGYSYPDNPRDDGDIDMSAGFSVYYSGSPGESLGDFRILYQDALGNLVPISLNECTQASQVSSGVSAYGGRSAPEYCTISATQPGVTYEVLFENMASPQDDSRLGYGFLLMNGSCRAFSANIVGDTPDECVITGEGVDSTKATVDPDNAYALVESDGDGNPTSTPYDPVNDSKPDSINFELAFCATVASGGTDNTLPQYCEQEASAKDCAAEPDTCFCGDPRNSPNGQIF